MNHLMKLTDFSFSCLLSNHSLPNWDKIQHQFYSNCFCKLKHQEIRFLHKSYNGDIRNVCKQCGPDF